MEINKTYLEQKLIILTKDLEYIESELLRFTIIKRKTEGAIEIIQGLIKDSELKEEVNNTNKKEENVS